MQKQFPIDHWLAREGKKEWAKEIPSYRNRSNEMVILCTMSTMHSHITVADCYYAPGRRRWWNWYLWLDCVWHNTQSAKEINLIPAVVMQFCNIPSVGLGRISWLDGMHQLFWLFFLQNCLLRIANYTRHTTLDRKCHFWTRVGICILHLSMHLECPLFLRPQWIALPEEYNSQTVGCVGQFVTQTTEPLVHPVWGCLWSGTVLVIIRIISKSLMYVFFVYNNCKSIPICFVGHSSVAFQFNSFHSQTNKMQSK